MALKYGDYNAYQNGDLEFSASESFHIHNSTVGFCVVIQ